MKFILEIAEDHGIDRARKVIEVLSITTKQKAP